MGGRVVLEGGGTLSQKQFAVDTSDPLDLSAPAPEEKPEEKPAEEEKPNENPPIEPDKESTTEESTETPPEEVQRLEAFSTDLDKALEAKTGVGLDGFVEAVTTLLSWYNDILALEQQQKTPTTPNVPSFQRSTGRNPSPATNSYDFRRSEILAMSPQDYDKNADAITRAWQAGRVLNDV